MNKNNKYVWDEDKCNTNIQKHHIDFADAVSIFEDPLKIERRSDRNGEERYEIIGAVNANILLVAYAVKEGDVIRIISARRASRNERKTYYQI